MIREVDLSEISDGKLYGANDLVRADCGGCEGCSACCRGMGSSIVLDPLDCVRLGQARNMTAASLLSGGYLELREADGLVLPAIRMQKETNACPFLDKEGRCSVHESRPGFCRLFPLGRYYHDRTFSYFLQTKECRKENRSKVKVKKWLGISPIAPYEQYIIQWHYFLKDTEQGIRKAAGAGSGQGLTQEQIPVYERLQRTVSMAVLKQFYLTPYEPDRFYEIFETRLQNFWDLFAAEKQGEKK